MGGGGSAGAVSTLALYLNLLQDAGSAIGAAVVNGPTPTHTRASSGSLFNGTPLMVLASTNEPRFDHDPSTGAARGLLIEEARTNILLQSEDVETTWTNLSGDTPTGGNTAPDGESTAFDIKHPSGNSNGLIQTLTVAATTIHTFSVFNKQGLTGEHDWLRTRYVDASADNNGIQAWFDLVTGALGAAGVATTGTGAAASGGGVVVVANGWYRRWMAGRIATGETDGKLQLLNAIADASTTEEDTNSALWWGMMLEAAAFPSLSYIATTTAPVTRAADVVSADLSSIDPLKTLYLEGKTGYGAGVLLQTHDGTEDERVRIERNASDEIHVIITDGGVEQCDLTLGTVADLTAFKVAVSFDTNDVKAILGGGSEQTDTLATMPTVDTMHLGRDTSGSYANYWCAAVKGWTEAKDSTFIADLVA